MTDVVRKITLPLPGVLQRRVGSGKRGGQGADFILAFSTGNGARCVGCLGFH